MPDIAMCKGEGCPIRDDCYRYRATPSEYVQSYFAVTPYDKKLGCEHYWEMKYSYEPRNGSGVQQGKRSRG